MKFDSSPTSGCVPTDGTAPGCANTAETVCLDDERPRFGQEAAGDPAQAPEWLWVRHPSSDGREVWERHFASEAPRNGSAYLAAAGPSPSAIDKAARSRSAPPAAARDAHDVPNVSPTMPLLMTVEEVAALLRIKPKTAYSMIASRQVPGGRRVGGVVRVHRDTLIASFQAAGASGKGRGR